MAYRPVTQGDGAFYIPYLTKNIFKVTIPLIKPCHFMITIRFINDKNYSSGVLTAIPL